ncbi:MAG: protein kinase domain-containing protein [Bradymonadaceae bacterium]
MAPNLPQQFGPYTLQELIARGGMAEIYRATMPGIGGFEKTVAIKKILPHLAENDEFITMLIDEARIIVSINHFNIAQVYDLGRIDDTYYIAMEYIHGVDLSGIIKTLARQKRHVPAPHAIYVGSAICAGLHVAHAKTDENGQPLNIVHRDISPHNVLLSFSGDVKIIDFGVAKASTKETHTKMGVIKGKILYMAPEQAMAQSVDGRADLFAAGLVMYKMVTNRLPFEGDNEFQIYNNILSKYIVAPKVLNPELPDAFNTVIMKLLARDPDQRYQDGYSAKQDLDRVLHQVAPGYTVNRLSRFVEDNFSHLLRRGEQQEASGPSGISPETPSSNQLETGQLGEDLPELRPESLEDGMKTVNLGSDRVQQAVDWGEATVANQSFPEPGSQPLGEQLGASLDAQRAAGVTGDTGQFALAQLEAGAAGKKRSISGAALAVIAMLLLTLGLGVYIFVFAPTDADATAAVVEPRPPEPPANVRMVQVTLDSQPQSARVYQDDQLIGITPLMLDLEASDESLTFRLKKGGYAERAFRLVPDDDISHTLELVATEAGEDEEEVEEYEGIEEAALKIQKAEEEAAARVEAAKRAEAAKKAPVRTAAPKRTSPKKTAPAPAPVKTEPAPAPATSDWIDIPSPKKKTEKKTEDKPGTSKKDGAGSDIIDPFDF